MKKQKSKLKHSEQRTVVPGEHLIAYLGLSRLFRFVLTVLIALSAVSCHSTKKLIQESRSEQSTELTDSELVGISETRVQPVKVPMSAVSLTLSLDSLRQLPLGAGYAARQGQANLKVRRKPPSAGEPGQVIIEASCDSLELVCANLTKTVSVLKKRLARQTQKSDSRNEKTEKTSSPTSVLTAFKWLLTGFVTGFILSKIKAIVLLIKRILYGK